MKCHRCQGLMVQDRAYDLLNSAIYCEVWRCVCCGNIFDHRMQMNRKAVESQIQPKTRFPRLQELEAA